MQPCIAPLLVFIISVSLLCYNLGARYLWQDEAATAVLAQRMVSHGRPLAYDGRNLITMDIYSEEDLPLLPTGDPKEAVRYHARRGDFKDDTTWIGQPWGQFVVAGVSLAIFGNDTVAARLPFTLAGALTATLLFLIVRRRLSSSLAASAAAALVLSNAFWIMHMRQCRYYALTSLLLLLTLETYLRWKEGKRWGGLIFIGAAWTWFQVDFGSLWPVLGILGMDAVITRARRIKETVLVFAGFCAVTAPFCFYYEIAGRHKAAVDAWPAIIATFLMELNQFQLPFIIIPPAIFLLYINWKGRSDAQSHSLVGLSLLIICALTLWMSLAAPSGFYRYIVSLTTLSAIVVVYVFMELARLIPRAKDVRWLVPCVFVTATFLFSFTNLLSRAVIFLEPPELRPIPYLSSLVRPEIKLLIGDLRNTYNDPNRAVVEFLRERIKPGDEILCNYEDIPLMFYFPNRVRGGISCFRVTDSGEASFAIFRKSSTCSHVPIYLQAFEKSRWYPHSLNAPDIQWANFPDPHHHFLLISPNSPVQMVFERVAQ